MKNIKKLASGLLLATFGIFVVSSLSVRAEENIARQVITPQMSETAKESISSVLALRKFVDMVYAVDPNADLNTNTSQAQNTLVAVAGEISNLYNQIVFGIPSSIASNLKMVYPHPLDPNSLNNPIPDPLVSKAKRNELTLREFFELKYQLSSFFDTTRSIAAALRGRYNT